MYENRWKFNSNQVCSSFYNFIKYVKCFDLKGQQHLMEIEYLNNICVSTFCTACSISFYKSVTFNIKIKTSKQISNIMIYDQHLVV